jgi:hypothetical protein
MWWKLWKKRNGDAYLVPHRAELNAMAAALLKGTEVDFDAASSLDQALIGTFLFGMIFAHGSLTRLGPPEVHALALCVFKDSLHYTDHAAAQAVQECINASKPGYHDTMNAILHRGIDGHRQYQVQDIGGLSQNLRTILDQFKNPQDSVL